MGSTQKRRVTLAQVANHAGVSLSTVSKVLNGRTDVAEPTRAAVEAAFSQLGYISRGERTAARPERSGVGRRKSLLLILARGMNPYAAEILEGAIAEASSQGLTVTVACAQDPAAVNPSALVQEMSADGHEGLIIVTPELTDEGLAFFARRGTPMAMIDPVNTLHDQGVSIGTANWSGGLTATEHLLAVGHRRIGFVGGPERSLVGQARLHGYRAALERAGIAFDPDLVGHGPFRFGAGHEIAQRLLDLDEPPTAVFAASDLSALGVLAAVRERNLRVPEDISVIGYDDTWAAEWATPALTVIRQPMPEMGRAAVRSVIKQMDGTPSDSRRVELATELVERASVAPPRT